MSVGFACVSEGWSLVALQYTQYTLDLAPLDYMHSFGPLKIALRAVHVSNDVAVYGAG
jgi:hypothetical protein